MLVLSYLLALLIGLSIGVMGSGGAILAVPILYYVAGFSMQDASVYSLFVVGSTSLVGAVRSAITKLVNWRAVLYFGVPSVASVYLTRLYVVPALPNSIEVGTLLNLSLDMILLVLFAVLMLLASRSMLLSKNHSEQGALNLEASRFPIKVIMFGILVGCLTAILGAGGGFLIIPALVLFMYLPMKEAIGTSMFIVAMNALNGFVGSMVKGTIQLDFRFLFLFTAMSLIGLFIGVLWSKKINPTNLKKAFAYFVLGMGLFIIIQQIIKHFAK